MHNMLILQILKANFQNMSIHTKKDATDTWHKFPYLVIEDDIMKVISKWPSDWITPSDARAGTSKVVEGEIRETEAMITTEKVKEKEV